MVIQPSIVNYSQTRPVGIQTLELSRHCIGFVARGRKRIYYGDVCHQVLPGQIFYLPPGHHALEDIPEAGKPAEQVACYLTSAQLAQIIARLHALYALELPAQRGISDPTPHIVVTANETLARFFLALADHLSQPETIIEQMRLMELIYLLLSRSDSTIGARLRTVTVHGKDDFEQIVRSHILNDISLEELAVKCNRSVTSFKKDFRALFREPPHRWLTRQRLLHARTALRSTDHSVSQIAGDCRFSTPSHFIKQFKKEYGVTPAHYRRVTESSGGGHTVRTKPSIAPISCASSPSLTI